MSVNYLLMVKYRATDSFKLYHREVPLLVTRISFVAWRSLEESETLQVTSKRIFPYHNLEKKKCDIRKLVRIGLHDVKSYKEHESEALHYCRLHLLSYFTWLYHCSLSDAWRIIFLVNLVH